MTGDVADNFVSGKTLSWHFLMAYFEMPTDLIRISLLRDWWKRKCDCSLKTRPGVAQKEKCYQIESRNWLFKILLLGKTAYVILAVRIIGDTAGAGPPTLRVRDPQPCFVLTDAQHIRMEVLLTLEIRKRLSVEFSTDSCQYIYQVTVV